MLTYRPFTFAAVRIIRFVILFLGCISVHVGLGQEVLSIGILTDKKIGSIQIIPAAGRYDVLADGKSVLNVDTTQRVSFKAVGSMVQIITAEKGSIGQYKKVKVVCTDSDAFLRLYVLKPTKEQRVYDDDIYISASSSLLNIVNRVSLEKYVAGVVEAETGKEKGVEFYKVQTIISRTYALSNSKRYLHLGYNLNDLVDCQVYHGKARWESDIIEAVDQTTSLVLVDSEMRLITAAFHSNSGGETVSSDAVWSKALPYLTPQRDEFSVGGEHYEWERRIFKKTWLDYLRDKYNLDLADEVILERATNYEQKYRQLYFIDPIFKIPLKDIRKDWRLNSTLFNITSEGDSLLFKGRGFGHGTGLSQEGAMRMANLGFSYVDILHFYYSDIHIIDLRALGFFIEE